MTPFTTRRLGRLLIPIIHLITRIYHAYRLRTNQVRPPFAFRIIQGRLMPVSSSLVRDLPSFATPSTTNQKVSYHQITFLPSMGISRLHAVYHVLSELSSLSYLYEYLLRYPWIFILFISIPGPLSLYFSHRT